MNANDSEGLARALFVEAGDALFLFDPQTDQLLDVNPMAERLTGFPRAEMLRLPATYLFRYGGKGGMQRLRQACHETMVFHAQDGFYLRNRQDGVWIPVNLTVTRLHVQPRTLALITARDVRERHEAQARLQEAEGELRRVLASVSDCLWSARLDGAGRWEYRYLSPVVERITGRSPAFFLAGPERWAELIHPEDRPRWAQALARLRAGQPGQEEYRIVRPDGAVRWVRDSVLVSRPPSSFLRLDGVLTDVTEARQAGERFRRILDGAHEAFVGMDAAGVIIDWNQQAEATFGWTRAEAVGRLLEETIIPAHHREAHRRGLERFLATGEGPLLHQRIEVTALHRDGHEFPVEVTITPLPLGGTHQFCAFVHDISERKRSEEALARERNLLRTLTDHLPDHIFVKDTHSRFVTANAATVHSLGAKTLEEVLGKTDFDFLPRERAEQFYADEQTVLRTGQPLFNREELLIDASGRRRMAVDHEGAVPRRRRGRHRPGRHEPRRHGAEGSGGGARPLAGAGASGAGRGRGGGSTARRDPASTAGKRGAVPIAGRGHSADRLDGPTRRRARLHQPPLGRVHRPDPGADRRGGMGAGGSSRRPAAVQRPLGRGAARRRSLTRSNIA